jgi:(E)-4-hydroxy-3-methylbut-2-enyl-diphosphate synthase
MRNKTLGVDIGKLTIGNFNPILVQSMTDTDTTDVESTVSQIEHLESAGSEIVRVTVNNDLAAKSVPVIKKRLLEKGIDVPIVGDFHFIGHRLLTKYSDCATSLDKYRINPGNVGKGSRRDKNFDTFIRVAKDLDKPIRIGVNSGSLDPELMQLKMDKNARLPNPLDSNLVEREALVDSALLSADRALKIGLPENKIVISCKVSRLSQMVESYKKLSTLCDFPLHLGLTEAGMGSMASTSTSIALGLLLSQGIGDTIRASLTPEPKGDRAKEVKLCQDVLQSLGLRSFRPSVTSCPGCGRTTSSFFRELSKEIEIYLEKYSKEWNQKYPGSSELKVAVMGCVVNGPGESKNADIGISLPGSGESLKAPVFIDGQKFLFLEGNTIAQDFIKLVDNYVEKRWGS